ncbi:unnamed protein product, partial [Ectocarpus sp. 8 AP-2014]
MVVHAPSQNNTYMIHSKFREHHLGHGHARSWQPASVAKHWRPTQGPSHNWRLGFHPLSDRIVQEASNTTKYQRRRNNVQPHVSAHSSWMAPHTHLVIPLFEKQRTLRSKGWPQL